MTILSTDNRRVYSGNGSTTVFSFPVRFLEAEDVKVAVRVSDVETELTQGVDFSVSGAGNPAGGSVTFTVAPVSGATVVIYNDPVLTQSVDYRDDDEFPAETHERALDKLTLIVQRLGARLARTLQYDETAPTILTASEVLTRVDDAETARDEAQTAATETAADLVETAADVIAAEAAKVAAQSAQSSAETAVTNAEAAETAAETAQTAAEAAQAAAETAETNTGTSEANAAASATAASGSATAAASSATAAAADAVQTAADRVATGLDVTAAETAKTAAEVAQQAAEAATPPFPISQVTGLQTSLDNKLETSALPGPTPAFRNLIVNGDMQVNQEGNKTAIVGGTPYGCDLHLCLNSSDGTIDITQVTDGPAGFGKCLEVAVNTADASLAAAQYCGVFLFLEGQNLQTIKKGTAQAEQTPLSFKVKTNVPGTYAIGIRDLDNNRHVGGSVTLVGDETWEDVSLVLPADTTGAFDNDNLASMQVELWLAAGSTFSSGTTQSAWGAEVTANRAAATNVNFMGNAVNYMRITGVQLEVGDTATEFEHLPYDVQLRRVQRYFSQTTMLNMFGSGSTFVSGNVIYPQIMRAVPSFEQVGGVVTWSDVYSATVSQSSMGVSAAGATTHGARITFSNLSSVVNGRGYVWSIYGSEYVNLDARL